MGLEAVEDETETETEVEGGSDDGGGIPVGDEAGGLRLGDDPADVTGDDVVQVVRNRVGIAAWAWRSGLA